MARELQDFREPRVLGIEGWLAQLHGLKTLRRRAIYSLQDLTKKYWDGKYRCPKKIEFKS
jgi:hypothetical protein